MVGLLDSIRKVIRTYLSSGGPSLELIAEAGGCSKRSLQRQLAALDTSLSDLVQRERMQTAEVLLSETDLRLADIAAEIGYSDPAHFTRAFRHWSGVAPSALRAERARSQARR